MTVSRPLTIGGGITAFVLIVAWMVPPTTPKGGATFTAASRAGQTMPRNVPATPPADASFTVPQPAPPPPVYGSADDGGAATAGPSPVPGPSDRGPSRSAPHIAADSDVERYAFANPQEEFDRGYRWAERRQVDDPRTCRRWAQTPREDGCLAFLQDAPEQGDDEQEDD